MLLAYLMRSIFPLFALIHSLYGESLPSQGYTLFSLLQAAFRGQNLQAGWLTFTGTNSQQGHECRQYLTLPPSLVQWGQSLLPRHGSFASHSHNFQHRNNARFFVSFLPFHSILISPSSIKGRGRTPRRTPDLCVRRRLHYEPDRIETVENRKGCLGATRTLATVIL